MIKLQAVRSEADFRDALAATTNAASGVPGHLTRNDEYLLTLLAVCPMAAGEIVEIGSFKGRSTVLLATALNYTGEAGIHACDPFAAPGVPGQDLKTDDAVYAEFQANLRAAGVTERVSVHRQFSTDLARQWNLGVRLLWVDGDHSYAGTTADYDAWHRFVNPGGYIAMHDVLHPSPGPSQVFANRILLDENWGACGFCGSIGWAQRVHSPQEARKFRDLKVSYYRKLTQVAHWTALGGRMQGLDKLRYKLARTRLPRRPPTFEQFARLVGYHGSLNAGLARVA